MKITGTKIRSALRRYLRSIPGPVLQVNVENDTSRSFKIGVILESFCRRKQDGLVRVLPEQPLDTLAYSRVVINDQNEVLILQADILTCLPQYPWLLKAIASDPFRGGYAISEGLPNVKVARCMAETSSTKDLTSVSISRCARRTRDVCSCCWLFA